VTVFDERANIVARSPALTQSFWIPADPLPRDRTYVWQITAQRGASRDTITAPLAPLPPATFHVIDARAADVLQRLEADHPTSHLLLGILAAGAGVSDIAIAHLRQVPATDPHADLARRLLETLRAR